MAIATAWSGAPSGAPRRPTTTVPVADSLRLANIAAGLLAHRAAARPPCLGGRSLVADGDHQGGSACGAAVRVSALHRPETLSTLPFWPFDCGRRSGSRKATACAALRAFGSRTFPEPLAELAGKTPRPDLALTRPSCRPTSAVPEGNEMRAVTAPSPKGS